MSTVSAGLVNVTNLTVTGTQSGAITSTNFKFSNLDLSGNLAVGGDIDVGGNLSVNGSVIGDLDVSGNLSVQGNTVLKTLDVSGNATVKTQPLEISSTLVATTEYVHQYSEILNNLHNKTFSIPLVFVLYEGMQSQGLPSASIITFTFYNNRDVKFVCGTENLESGGTTQQSTSPYPNTIIGKFEITDSSEITIKINYLNGKSYVQIPGTRYLYLTFNNKCDAITKVVEDSDGLIELRTLASTITDFDVSGNFLSEFILSYQDNSGNSLFNIDASGNYDTHCDTSGIIVDTSGVIGNINNIYLLDTVNWKIPVQAALISTNANVVKSIVNGRIYPGKLDYITNVNMKTYSAGLVIANKEHTFGYSPVTGIPDGILVDYKSDTTASIKSNDIYTIPMEFEHSDQRLNGVSRSYFEPIHNEIFLGRNCTYTEPVNADSSGNPARLKHIATRGIDVIAMHSRIHIDPSVYCYTKGRNILYCRHSQTWLNNTFWYPDGPEFRISLAPALTVTKLLFNDVEIPGYMIKRKNWDRYYDNTESNLRDDKAITFNIAKATQYVSGFTMKYSSDPSGNYVLADLNKVEIWYQGNTLYPVSASLAAITPTIIWGISNDGVPLNTSLGNIQFNDHLTTMQTKYSIPGPPIDKILNGLTKDGLIVWPNINVNSSLINDYNTQVSFWPNDPRPDHLNAFVPINDLCNDAWYLQFEIMCPKPFNVATGGKQLTPIESSDGKNTLYKFVPGYMDTSGDHKSNYGTAFAFNVTEYKSKEFQITLTSGKQIPYYLHAPQQFIDAVIDGSLNNLAYLQPASIQKTVRIMESILSPYPHETIGISFSQDANSPAMEHREMVSMGNNVSFATIIHEIIHQWWQNLISFNSNREFWTDEGFDTFIMFFVMDMYFKDGTNRAYSQNIGTKQKEIADIGFGNKSISNYIGSADYPNAAYAWALMYYNWGSSNKVDSSNNLIVRPMDTSGNEVIRIIGDSNIDTRGWGLMNKSDLYNYDYASIIIDSSGTIAFVNSLYQIVDSSYNRISDASGIKLNVFNPQALTTYGITLYLRKIDGNPIIQEDYISGSVVLQRNLVDVLGNTVTNYVTMPSTSMERYYASYDSSGVVNLNTYYMDSIKLLLTNFANHFYTTTDIANTFGDYVDAHFADWSGNNLNTGCWPSCKLDILVYWNEVLRVAGSGRKFTDNYPLNYDTDYLPVGTNINPVPTLTIVKFDDEAQLNIYKFALTSWMSLKVFNFTAPVLWLNNNGTSLLGGSLDDFTTHGQDFTGKIALVRRGVHNFQVKTINAQAAGAVACVVYVNPGQTAFAGAVTSAWDLQIPYFMISSNDGLHIISSLNVTPGLTMSIDGKFPIAS